MPIKYLALEDTDEVITLVEDKNKVEQIPEGEEEEEEEEKDDNNQGVRLNSEKLIVIRQDVHSASARELQAYLTALENASANPRHHSHVTVVQNGFFIQIIRFSDRHDFWGRHQGGKSRAVREQLQRCC